MTSDEQRHDGEADLAVGHLPPRAARAASPPRAATHRPRPPPQDAATRWCQVRQDVTLVLVIVDHTELMLPGVNLEVEEEQQQERGDAIDHEVAVGEVILKWSKLEMLIFIFIRSWRTPSIFYKLIGRGKFLIQSF